MVRGDTNEDYTHRADRDDPYVPKESGGLRPCFNGVRPTESFTLGTGQLLQQSHPEESRVDLCRGVRRQRHLRRRHPTQDGIQASGRGL